MVLEVFLNPKGVLHGTQGKELLQPHTRQPGLGGLGPGGKQQLVVGFFKPLAAFQITHRYSLSLRVNGGDFVLHPHIHPEPGEKAFWGLKGQLLRVLNDPADVIGQATVGVRDISRTFKHHDFRLLVQPANPGGRRSASRHATYNHNFHLSAQPFLYRYSFR